MDEKHPFTCSDLLGQGPAAELKPLCRPRGTGGGCLPTPEGAHRQYLVGFPRKTELKGSAGS